MFLEVHVIQNFAFSNLNRDDTGAPKTCMFGGARRARISSQCLKRAIRTYVREEDLVPAELFSYRTKLLHRELSKRFTADGIDSDEAGGMAEAALKALGLKLKKDKTEYLLMLGEREMASLAATCLQNREKLLGKEDNKDGKLSRQLLQCIDGGQAMDIALFGRMIATHADKGVDAAVQMAHAFSTHAVAMEFDFFSAIDDLQQEDDDEGAGAGMLGVTLFNSSCYYRYANLDLNQLMGNLGGDLSITQGAAEAFLRGMVYAVPTGKRTNSAPQNPPAFVFAVLRDRGLWSLANAFVRPVFAGPRSDLVELSAKALLSYWKQLAEMYETKGIGYAGATTYLSSEEIGLDDDSGITVEPNLSGLLGAVQYRIKEVLNQSGAIDDSSSTV